MKFQTRYTHTRERSKTFATTNKGESKTQQDASDSEVNIIMKKFGTTALIPRVQSQPLTGTFDSGETFQEMLDKVNEAKRQFDNIPADIRGRFLNNPANFLTFASDPKNLDELRRMGLANAAPELPKPPEPMLVKVVQDPAPGAK